MEFWAATSDRGPDQGRAAHRPKPLFDPTRRPASTLLGTIPDFFRAMRYTLRSPSDREHRKVTTTPHSCAARRPCLRSAILGIPTMHHWSPPHPRDSCTGLCLSEALEREDLVLSIGVSQVHPLLRCPDPSAETFAVLDGTGTNLYHPLPSIDLQCEGKGDMSSLPE